MTKNSPRTKWLVWTMVACAPALPLVAQEPARDALRALTYEESNDRILAHLVALLPQARDAEQLEAAVDRWVADLDPADTVNVRHRIHELLRETPEGDLYGLLLAVIRHRFQSQPLPGAPSSISSASHGCRPGYMLVGGRCCPGGSHQGCYNPNPTGPKPTPKPQYPQAPPPPPVESWRIIGSVGSQIWNARGNCSELARLAGELVKAYCDTGTLSQIASCKASRAQVYNQLAQLQQEANC